MSPPNTSPNALVFSYDDAQKMVAEYRHLIQRRAAIDGEIEATEAKLRAAALLFNIPFGTLVGEEEDESDEPTPMTDAIVAVLNTAHRALTRKEIRDRLSQDEALRKRLDRTPNSFYNAMKRLVARELVVQEGDTFAVPNNDKAD